MTHPAHTPGRHCRHILIREQDSIGCKMRPLLFSTNTKFILAPSVSLHTSNSRRHIRGPPYSPLSLDFCGLISHPPCSSHLSLHSQGILTSSQILSPVVFIAVSTSPLQSPPSDLTSIATSSGKAFLTSTQGPSGPHVVYSINILSDMLSAYPGALSSHGSPCHEGLPSS